MEHDSNQFDIQYSLLVLKHKQRKSQRARRWLWRLPTVRILRPTAFLFWYRGCEQSDWNKEKGQVSKRGEEWESVRGPLYLQRRGWSCFVFFRPSPTCFDMILLKEDSHLVTTRNQILIQMFCYHYLPLFILNEFRPQSLHWSLSSWFRGRCPLNYASNQ